MEVITSLRRRVPFRVWLLQILALAAANFLAGKLGLLLAIPPGYASAVWPPSGIALAAILLLGYRVWPGVWLGSFLINIGTSLDPSAAAPIWRSVLLVGAIAAGSSLQAVLGAFLIRRFVGSPGRLDRGSEVIRFLFLGGPVSCLLAATVGATGLVLAGAISWTSYAFTWSTWWAGDTIGVLVFTPLLVTWLAEPRGEWRSRRTPVTLALGLAFAAAVVVFLLASFWERNRIRLEFERQAKNLAHALEIDLESYLEVLQSLGRFYGGSTEVGRQDFHTFVEPLFSRHPGIRYLSWNPRVPAERRASFEEEARSQGDLDFEIKERDAQGRLVRAGHREEYVSILHMEPDGGDRAVLGFDVSSDPIRREALHRARDTGRPVASGRVLLVQEPAETFGLVISLPVYGLGLPRETVEERRRNLRGYAVEVFRLSRLVDVSFEGLDRAGVEVRLFDETAPKGERLLCDSRAEPRHSTPGEDWEGASGLHWARTHSLAGRQWRLLFSATPDYLAARRSWVSWMVLVGGLLFTAMLQGFLLVVTGTTARTERLVVERTAELAHANASLLQEAEERRRAEEALRESEERKRLIIETAHDAFVGMNAGGAITDWNPQAEKTFGWSREEALGRRLADTIIPESFREAHRRGLECFLRTGEGPVLNKRFELTALHRDGHQFPVELTISPVQWEGSFLFNAFLHDITERKRREAELAQRVRLGAFAADVGAALTRSESLASSLQECAEAMVRHLGGSIATIWTLDAKEEMLDLQGAAGLRVALPESQARIPVGRYRVGSIARDREPQLVDLRTDPSHENDKDWGTQHGMVSLAGYPLMVQNRTVGVMAMYAAEPLSAPVLQVMASVADEIALGIDRNRAAEELRRSEEEFRSAFHHAGAGVAQLAPDGRFLRVNRALCEMVGYTQEELLSKGSLAITHPEDSQQEIVCLRQLLAGEIETFQMEKRYLHKDGRHVWVSLSVSAVRDVRGARYFIGQIQNITARKLAEEALRASEARTRSLVGHMLEGLLVVDEAGSIQEVNPAAERIFGYRREELLGRPLSLLVPAPVGSDRQGLMREAQRRALGQVAEWEARRKDGEVFPAEISLFEFWNPDGRHFGASVRDISERRKVDRLKREFVSTVSHELRTPLTSIRGSLGLLAGRVAGGLPPEAKSLVRIALNNSERLARLVNDILDLEKVELGRLEFRLEPIELAPLVKATVESNRAYGEEYKVRFRLKDTAPGARVKVDRDRFAQALTNLLSNAAKFSSRGEAVIVSVERRGGKVRVSVADRGPGIPEEFRPHIFERFQRADASDSRKKKGTGLGLAITKSIVERLGGEIGFESEAGRGTTFFLDLPEWKETEKKVTPSGDPRPRVLICEDNPEDARQLSEIFESAGFASETVSGVAEARSRASRSGYAALVLDLRLPDGNGLELLRELHSREETRHLPVVVVSIVAEEGRREFSGNSVSLVEWINKPLDRRRLLETIERVVRPPARGLPRILHVEDDPDVCELISWVLRDRARVVAAPTLQEARERLGAEAFDLILLDLVLPDGKGLSLLPLAKDRSGHPLPIVVFSANEMTPGTAETISAVLLKSRTTNAELRETIRRLTDLPAEAAAFPGPGEAREVGS